MTRPRGIFKPRQMQSLLSIKTVIPKPGRKVWYDDQDRVHNRIFESDESVDYDFMGQNPDAATNHQLREAMDNRIPVIYFIGTAPGLYCALFPAFVTAWDRAALKARISFVAEDRTGEAVTDPVLERRYALREVKQRLHQSVFREAVVTAYDRRCALSGLPEPILLDAAHIIPDSDEQYGQPVVSNGIPLSKLHHAAFDAHLIGIDPDYHLHVSERLRSQHDGPMLEALKSLHHKRILLPNNARNWPDQDRLARRFEDFRMLA